MEFSSSAADQVSPSMASEGTPLVGSYKKVRFALAESPLSKKVQEVYNDNSGLKLFAIFLVLLAVASFAFQSDSSTEKSILYGNTEESTNTDHPKQSRTTNSKYKKVQGIGFQIYTGGAPAFLGDQLNPECVDKNSYGQMVTENEPEMQCYVGLEDPMDDVTKRLNIMKAAVEKAYATADNGDEEILKVFIAPEFYWRGVNGAYVFQQEEPGDDNICGPVCQLLIGLEDIVAQQRFENWLFVFGTVIASDVLPTEDPYDFLFYNFAPVYKGYDPQSTSHTGKRFLVPKRYVSSSDFLTPQRHLNPSAFKELLGQNVPDDDFTVYNPFDFRRKRYDDYMWKMYRNELNNLGYTMIEYDWLMVDGLSVTLEICFDHQMRTALNSYLGDIIRGRSTLIPSSSDSGIEYVRIPQYQAQISIVSSAGMTVTPDSLALTNNGTIFLQDGLSNATNRMFWSMVGCEQGLEFEGGTEAAQREAYLSNTDVTFEHRPLEALQRYDLYEDYEGDLLGVFSTKVYPPQITVFDPVDIARVSHN